MEDELEEKWWRDREYFAQHPMSRYYVRRPFEEEFGDYPMRSVLVIRISDDIRFRYPTMLSPTDLRDGIRRGAGILPMSAVEMMLELAEVKSGATGEGGNL